MTENTPMNLENIKLCTQRLVLRKMLPSDFLDMYEYACRRDVTEYLLWREHENAEYTRRYLRYIQKLYRKGEFFDFAVTLRDSGKMIGTAGFAQIDTENRSAQIGYVLNPRYRGLGYAPEAAEAVMRYGFYKLGLHRIEARCMHQNEASKRVMQKLGMRHEGTHRDAMLVKGKYRTIDVFAVLSEEFAQKNDNAQIQMNSFGNN